MSNLPIINDIKAYEGATFDFSFTFVDEDNGDPIDLSVLDNIKMKIIDLFNLSTDAGTLAIENTNNLTGRIEASQMGVAKRIYYYDIKTIESNGWVTPVAAGKFKIITAADQTRQTTHNFTLQIEPFN
ncbi:hypothetical protein ACG2F4_14410 [Halalkalibaculum sp. DA3122]|uniref:hypothetical protein n=1 Tax=Halalkalibaculum sp. DA3122 TaxID=3373607 RepID=UPI003754A614